ncbi:C-C motif chemokine 20 isoform X2 [Mastacembelus armatus]|uniref:C-C motif chemokine 20 isoform X2 n=1 Tax=Mastacembelus armatus TaxID=205130 RepID=UPI000E45B669|nr:C-C motif chemokine 20-like isoform X2 [Mastacembelus armatus]
MDPRGVITLTAVLLSFILALLTPAPAARSPMRKSCCTRYYRKPVPFQRITGYREQTFKENCHIEAIIFYTVKKAEICVTRNDEWVRKALDLLSSKLKKMSKTGSETPTNKSRLPVFSDGSGSSFLSDKEAFLNNNETFF